MSRYSYDSKLLAQMQLPVFLRKPKITAIFEALLKPVMNLSGMFNKLRWESNAELYCTGQTMWLEKRLNELFNGETKIYISDGVFRQPLYLSNKREGYPPVYLGGKNKQVYLRNLSESTTETDFYVNIPASLYNSFSDETKIRFEAIIRKYKLLYVNFSIKTY